MKTFTDICYCEKHKQYLDISRKRPCVQKQRSDFHSAVFCLCLTQTLSVKQDHKGDTGQECAKVCHRLGCLHTKAA